MVVRSDVTPSGKPVKDGSVVATPAVGVLVTQQCMCDAVVPEVRPENVTWTRIVTAVGEKVTRAKPVPAEVTGPGYSLSALRYPKNL